MKKAVTLEQDAGFKMVGVTQKQTQKSVLGVQKH